MPPSYKYIFVPCGFIYVLWIYFSSFSCAARRRSFQPSRLVWRERATLSAPAGTSLVTVVPAAVNARSPSLTGETRLVLQPMKQSSTDLGAVLVIAVVVDNDRAAAEVDALADGRVADIRSGAKPLGAGCRWWTSSASYKVADARQPSSDHALFCGRI